MVRFPSWIWRTTITSIDVGVYPEGINLLPDGKTLYVSCWGDNAIKVIDSETLEVTETISVGEGPRAYGEFIAPR